MLKDLIGQMFGKLKVIKRADDKNKKPYWLCECQCHNKTLKIVRGSHLTSNRIKSCGCLYKERIRSEVPPNKFLFREYYKIGITDYNEEFYYDIADASLIEQYSWYFDKDGYVVARINKKGVKLHKLITNTDYKTKVDHKNKHRYDNRRINLRQATNSQNGMNIDIRKDNTSGVTGVGWSKKYESWRARITYEGKEIHLGYFDDFDEAVKIRLEAEKKYFKEFSPNNKL